MAGKNKKRGGSSKSSSKSRAKKSQSKPSSRTVPTSTLPSTTLAANEPIPEPADSHISENVTEMKVASSQSNELSSPVQSESNVESETEIKAQDQIPLIDPPPATSSNNDTNPDESIQPSESINFTSSNETYDVNNNGYPVDELSGNNSETLPQNLDLGSYNASAASIKSSPSPPLAKPVPTHAFNIPRAHPIPGLSSSVGSPSGFSALRKPGVRKDDHITSSAGSISRNNFGHVHSASFSSQPASMSSSPAFTGNNGFSKRSAYIRQVSTFSDGPTALKSPSLHAQHTGNSNSGNDYAIIDNASSQSPVLRSYTPNSMLLDDESLINGYGAISGSASSLNAANGNLTQLPRRGKLKPKMKSYWAYYIPALEWVPQYKRKYLLGDISAGITMASFQIPVSMSYATSLAHVPMVCGLYGLVIPPFIYGFIGSTPRMVVGPEAAISLIVGQAVSPYLHSDKVSPAHISGIMSGAAGAVLLSAGLLRFGYLDSVLSRALLRGFISAVGIVMVIDQFIAELSIEELMHQVVGTHATTWEKLVFLIHNANQGHKLTAIFSFIAVFVIITFRLFKAKVSKAVPQLVFVPEILIVVIVSTILTDVLDLDERGLEVVGTITPGSVEIDFPLKPSNWKLFKETFSASFMCAILGFFESTIATKSLGATDDINVSTNRELVALGVTNIVGSMVNALPSFGGYGRSKINVLSGARTNFASVVFAITVAFCIAFAMPYFYYLPRCVLSAVISVIGLSLIEEAPKDIMFYLRIGGYEDLFTMGLIVVCTVFWSLSTGIAIGVGFSLVRVIRHSTRSRIQILGRIPGTNTFENADSVTPDRLEEIDGCLICKIPEPLTFANTGDLRNRLRRLEVYGSMRVHPSFPRLRHEEMTSSVIFDLHGMTECDSSAMQILMEIVTSYVVDRNIPVLFARVPQSKKVRELFKLSGVEEMVTKPSLERYFGTIEEALKFIDQRGLNYHARPDSVGNRA